MNSIQYKKIPKGFTYPVSRRDINQLIDQYESCVFNVEFLGTMKPYSKLEKGLFDYYFCHPIHLFAERDEMDRLSFRLRIHAMNDDLIPDEKERLSKQLLKQIRQWFDAKIDLPHLAPIRNQRELVSYKISKSDRKLII